jgi:hypothetical protein
LVLNFVNIFLEFQNSKKFPVQLAEVERGEGRKEGGRGREEGEEGGGKEGERKEMGGK